MDIWWELSWNLSGKKDICSLVIFVCLKTMFPQKTLVYHDFPYFSMFSLFKYIKNCNTRSRAACIGHCQIQPAAWTPRPNILEPQKNGTLRRPENVSDVSLVPFFGFRLGLTRVARNSMLDHWQIGKSITLLNNSTGFRSCARLEAAQVTSVSDAGKLILGFMGHPEFVRPTYYRLQESVQLQVRPTAFRGKGTNVLFGYVMIQSCFALLLCIGAHIQGTLLFFACNDKFGDCPPLFFFTN